MPIAVRFSGCFVYHNADSPYSITGGYSASRFQGIVISPNDKGKVEGLVRYAGAGTSWFPYSPGSTSWDALQRSPGTSMSETGKRRLARPSRDHRRAVRMRPGEADGIAAGAFRSLIRRRRARGSGFALPGALSGQRLTRCPIAYGHQEVWVRGYVHEDGDRLRRRGHRPAPTLLRTRGPDLRADPLSGLAGADRSVPSIKPPRWPVGSCPRRDANLRRLLEARMGKAGKREYVQVLRSSGDLCGLRRCTVPSAYAVRLGAIGL